MQQIKYRIYKDKNTVTFEILDKKKKEKIGQVKYDINGKIGELHSVFIYPEFRNKGILKQVLPDILCDMTVEGIKTVKLTTLNEEAEIVWQKLNFIKKGKHMERTIHPFICKERSSLK